MTFPHWIWRVRFQTPAGGGETLVVAPHPAGAKLSISGFSEVTSYEIPKPLGKVPESVASQRFDGYYPRARRIINTIRDIEWLEQDG